MFQGFISDHCVVIGPVLIIVYFGNHLDRHLEYFKMLNDVKVALLDSLIAMSILLESAKITEPTSRSHWFSTGLLDLY